MVLSEIRELLIELIHLIFVCLGSEALDSLLLSCRLYRE